jgi:hypothetical protein
MMTASTRALLAIEVAQDGQRRPSSEAQFLMRGPVLRALSEEARERQQLQLCTKIRQPRVGYGALF